MPQPFKRKPNQKIEVSAQAILKRPWAAIDVGYISSCWNWLEFQLGTIYTYLLQGKEPSAFTSYHNTIDLKIRERMLLDAATGRLSDELIKEIVVLYQDVRKLAKSRNDVIHGHWAIVEGKEQIILLVDPTDTNKAINKLLIHLARLHEGKSKVVSYSVDLSDGDYIRYDHEDFQFIVRRILALNERAATLSQKVIVRALELLTAPDH